MLETILTIAGSIAGILATTAIPIIVAWISHREKKRRAEAAEATPTFGIALSPDAERADRMTAQLISSLEAARDKAEARAEKADARADAAEARELSLLAERGRLLTQLARFRDRQKEDPHVQ